MKRVGGREGGRAPPKIVCISKVEGGGGSGVFNWDFTEKEDERNNQEECDLGKESVSPLLSQAQRCQAGRHWPRAGGHGLFRPGDPPRCTVCPCLVTPTLCPQEGISSSARSLGWSFWMAGMGGGART